MKARQSDMYGVSLVILLLFKITIQPFYFFILLVHLSPIFSLLCSSSLELLANDQRHELIRASENMFRNNSVNISSWSSVQWFYSFYQCLVWLFHYCLVVWKRLKTCGCIWVHISSRSLPQCWSFLSLSFLRTCIWRHSENRSVLADDALVDNQFVHFEWFIVQDIVNFCKMTIRINTTDIIYLFMFRDESIDVIMDLSIMFGKNSWSLIVRRRPSSIEVTIRCVMLETHRTIFILRYYKTLFSFTFISCRSRLAKKCCAVIDVSISWTMTSLHQSSLKSP